MKSPHTKNKRHLPRKVNVPTPNIHCKPIFSRTVRVPFGRPRLRNPRLSCVQSTVRHTRLYKSNCCAGGYRRLLTRHANTKGILLIRSKATTLRVTTLLVSYHPNSRVVVPSCAFISATGTFILHNNIPMFISVEPSARGVSRALVRTTVASHAHTVYIIRCTNITYRVSTVVRVTRERHLCIVRSTTRNINSYCEKHQLNSVNRLNYCDFRRAGGIVSKRKKTLLIGSPSLVRHTRVVQRGKAGHTEFFHKRISGCA